MSKDNVNHPKHYTEHPSGIECIEVTRHMGFNLGNAIKYIWRADLKENTMEDLEKARWYINDEIKKRKNVNITSPNTEFTCKKCKNRYEGYVYTGYCGFCTFTKQQNKRNRNVKS